MSTHARTLPLSKALTMTFAYLTSEAGRILRVLWAPVLLFQIGVVLVMPLYAEPMIAFIETSAEADPSEALTAIAPMLAWSAVIMLAWLIFSAVCTAGLLRHLNRGEQVGSFYYLQFGADELQVFFTTLFVAVILFLAYIGAILFAVIFAAIGGAVGGPIGLLAVLAAVVAAFVGFMLVTLRLSLSGAAAVAERSLGVGPSWRVTQKSGWSLFGYWLIWMLIIMFVASVYTTLAMPNYFDNMAEIMAVSPDSEEYLELNRKIMRESFAIWTPGHPRFPLSFAASYVYMFVLSAIFPVAAGVAYRLLTQEGIENDG